LDIVYPLAEVVEVPGQAVEAFTDCVKPGVKNIKRPASIVAVKVELIKEVADIV